MKENQEYKVLARKYRPQRFTDLICQTSLVSILSNAILSKRIANAYVLTGVRGVGKTTTARLIAMGLNCQKKYFFLHCLKLQQGKFKNLS